MSTKDNNLDICKELANEWKQTCEKESLLISKKRLALFDLWADEVKSRKAFLKIWQPVPTEEKLEEDYSQSEIEKAQKKLRDKQAQLEKSKKNLEDELQKVKKNVADQRTTIKEKEKDLKNLLDKLVALPGQIEGAKVEVKKLKEEQEEAKEEWRKKLIGAELKMAEMKQEELEKLLSEEEPLNSAVAEAYKVWQKELQKLEIMIIGAISDEKVQDDQTEKDGDNKPTQENLEIEIAKIVSQLEYLKERWNALIDKYQQGSEMS